MKLYRTFLCTALAPVVCFGVDTASAKKTRVPLSQLCRATISTVMGRELKIIRVDKSDDARLAYVSYVRPDDNSIWAFKCKVDGNRVTWANADGRWRDDARDSVISFEVHSRELGIEERFVDGSMNYKLFPLDRLR